jgi:hypothetical protein
MSSTNLAPAPPRVQVTATLTQYSDAGDAVAAAATTYFENPAFPRERVPGLWVVCMIPGDPVDAYYRIVTAVVVGDDPLEPEIARATVRDAFTVWEDRKLRRGIRLGRSWILRFPEVAR